MGTLFVPKEYKLHHRERWIAFGSEIVGKIYVDKGAEDAIVTCGKSLLPIGVTGFEGNFEVGGTVSILTVDKKEIARGIVDYNCKDLKLIMGHKSSEIIDILGYKAYDYVVHRNNMVIGTQR